MQNKAAYVAIGLRLDGSRELLGVWLEMSEGLKFWQRVLAELQKRGMEDVPSSAATGSRGCRPPSARSSRSRWCRPASCTSKGHFPNDEAAIKLLYLARRNIERKWEDKPAHRQWRVIYAQLVVRFGARAPA